MSNKTGSRGPTLNNDELVEKVGGNRFELVLIAAQRAREIARAHKHSGKTESVYAPVSALLEIQEGKVGREYIRKIGK
jgi:DNA-directed RNA polymerase omega subunit